MEKEYGFLWGSEGLTSTLASVRPAFKGVMTVNAETGHE
jgi:hypothetical protein